ncbi:uncharacterized protein LOC126251450 [Schistocerca nitens]|uniref:uncharacterized protein LOC126251450 n=1 Tax=Schistocerca nitens TaxID=7011 RepID=UPI00211918CA|nr:uncharacterized protein LOC126251450 [Schistocerca nitens]
MAALSLPSYMRNGCLQLQLEPSQTPREEEVSRRCSLRSRCLPRSRLPSEYDLWWSMPRGRARGRGRGCRRPSGPGTRRGSSRASVVCAKLLGPTVHPQLPPVAPKFDAPPLPPSMTAAQLVPNQPLVPRLPPPAEERSQDSRLLTPPWSAVFKYHLAADIGQLVQSKGRRSHSVADIRRSSTGDESSAYTSVPLSSQSSSESSTQYLDNFDSHSMGELESRSSSTDPDADVQSQTVSEGTAQSSGAPCSWVPDSKILENSFVDKFKFINSENQEKPFFSDHNANFLSHFTSISTAEVLQSDNENSVSADTLPSKQQCFHSTVRYTSYNDAKGDGNSDVYRSKEASSAENEISLIGQRLNVPRSTVWQFAPPLELPTVWPAPFDRPTKQSVEFITSTRPDKVLLDNQCLEQYTNIASCQPDFTSPSSNTSSIFSHRSVSKWRFKHPPKRYLSKLRLVKSANVPLKRSQTVVCSNALTALEEFFLVFCNRCRPPGHTHPRNQNKIIKKRYHKKYWSNLHILKNSKLSNITDENGEIKCSSCHRLLWKCHKNNDMFKIKEMTPNHHDALGSNCSVNETGQLTGIGESETEDTVLQTTKKVQNQLSHSSDRECSHIPSTTAEGDGPKTVKDCQHLNHNLDPTYKVKLQKVTFIVCVTDERQTGTIAESQRVQVPCQTGREFMEISNKSNPYPYKISGIFGSENGISACLEDKGDLSNEFDFDISNSGELTLPSYEAQLVVSKDKAEAWNLGDNSVFLALMCKHSSCAEGISHCNQTAEMTACNHETDSPVNILQILGDTRGHSNSVKNVRKAPFEEMSSNRNETIGHKNSYIQTKEMNALTGEADHPVVIHQPNGCTGGQLTSIQNRHSGSNHKSSEKISSNMNETVSHKKNNTQTKWMTSHHHDSSVVMPKTDHNRGEHLNSTKNTHSEGTEAQLEEISSVVTEMLDHNEKSALGSRHNENSNLNSTVDACEETECFVCIKEEDKVSVAGDSKETSEVVNDNFLQNTDTSSNHCTCREETAACENTHVPFGNIVTVKEEAVMDEEEDFGPDRTCSSCFMCTEEKKQMHHMSATINTGTVVVTKSSSILASKDKLVVQSCQTDESSAGSSSDAHNDRNNSNGKVETLLVQSSNSSTNDIDLSMSDSEELNQGVNSSRSPRETAEEASEGNEDRSLNSTEPVTGQQVESLMMEFQDSVRPPVFIYGGNNDCIEEQVTEQLNLLSSNTTETFDHMASEHETDEVVDQLCNIFSENFEDSCTSEIPINDTMGSVMLMEKGTEYRLCSIQEELPELNVPHASDKQFGITHEDGLQQNCNIPSSNESQNCVIIKDEVHNPTTESTEDSQNAENEMNNNTSSVMPHEQNAEYRLCNFQGDFCSTIQPVIEHDDRYQQNYDTSSTNESHSNLIIKYESSSDQEYGSCFTDSETDSDSDESVKIVAEIRCSGGTSNNQPDGRLLHTSPLSSTISEDTFEFVGSGCSPVSSMTEMKHAKSFFTNHGDDRPVPKSPLSNFNTKDTCNSVDSGCTSTLDRITIKHSKITSNNQPVDNQVSMYPQYNLNSEATCESLDSKCMSTLARTLHNSVDCNTTSAAETIHSLETKAGSLEMEQTSDRPIRVSIPLSSITDPGLLERLLSERNRRTAGHTGDSLTQTPEKRTLEKSSEVLCSPPFKIKMKAVNRYEIVMNGRGKRTFEKVSQTKEVDDLSLVADLPSHKGSEKKHENGDTGARDVIESSSSAATKNRDTLHNNEKQNAEEICKQKNVHRCAVHPKYEDVSDEEGELQICEEEGDEEEETQDNNSEENVVRVHTVLSCEDICEEKQTTSLHLSESDKLIKGQDTEGSNLTSHQKDADLEPPQYSCGNQAVLLECQTVSSVPEEHEVHSNKKLSTVARDELQVIMQKESLSPLKKLPEIKQPCSPLQQAEQNYSSNDLSSETSRPILPDVKARETMELGYCGSLDAPDSLQNEKSVLDFDESPSKSTPEGRIGAEDTSTPFRKVLRKTINEKDVHGRNSEEQEVRESRNSVCMNKVLIYSSSKSSNKRISSKARMKCTDIDSLPPSYQILRRDLNEVLEQEKLCQASYSLPRKVPKKMSVPKVGGYRRPREFQKAQVINDEEESSSKKIRKEEPDSANSEVSVEDQEKSSVQEEAEYMVDQNPHTTKNLCQELTDLTAKKHMDGHQHNQHQKKKKPAIVQPEEMEVCHDKPALPEKESTVSSVCQSDLMTNKRKKCTVRLKRCDRFSWIQCANESTVVESEDIGTEKTPTSDECGKTESLPEKNVASEHTPSQELNDQCDEYSVVPTCSKIQMESKTSVAEEELEAVYSHGHKLDTDVSHSQCKKILLQAENKKRDGSNISEVAEQSQQCHSRSPGEVAALENIVNSPNQATNCSSPVHHQSRQEDFTKENVDNREQDHSVNSDVEEEGDENSRSCYRIAESQSEDQVSQDVVERRAESPHVENIVDLPQELVEEYLQQNVLQESVEELLSLVTKSKHFKHLRGRPLSETIATLTRVLKEMKNSKKIPYQSLLDKIQMEQHVTASEVPSDSTTEQSVPEQQSHELKTEFQQHNQSPIKQPLSVTDETKGQRVIQKPEQKLATDFQDPEEKLPESHLCEADSQDVVLHQREPSTHEMEGLHTENKMLPPARHKRHESQKHDFGSQPRTSQSQQIVTSNQSVSQESLSCSERINQYSEPTSADEEETRQQQKADQQYAIQHSVKEREQSQEKDVEPHNPQAQMLIQQQVQDQHRLMLNTIKQQKHHLHSMQQIAQQKEAKCHKEMQQSSLEQPVIQTHTAVQQWHHIQHASHHHQTQCIDMDKFVPQQQNVYSGAPHTEKATSIVQNPLRCHQTMLQQQQQLQQLASLEQQPMRQLAAMPNAVEQPQQIVQQQMECQQQRAAHHISRSHITGEHQTVPQNHQQTHPYHHRLYFPQIQQHYQFPHSTEVQMRPNYPNQYHSRYNSPSTWSSNAHLLRQVPCGPLDAQQLQPQQQHYPHFHQQHQLERWHSSRRPGTDVAATVPAVMPSPSMSGGTVAEPEHDRRRILSREAINSFDTGHRIDAVPSSRNATAGDFYSHWGAMNHQSRCCADRRFQQKCHNYGIPQAYRHYGRAWMPTVQQNLYQVICPVTPASTENIHTAQVHPSPTYMRTGPHPQPNSSTAPVQAPLNTASIHQRPMKLVQSSTVDQEQRPMGHGGRLKIPTPPIVSPFVERVMKGYQPDMFNTEDLYRYQYKLPEREWAARFALPQDTVHTRHGTTTVQQLPYSQPVIMFPEHTRIPASPTQPLLYKTVHTVGQSSHRMVVPPPTSFFDDSVNNSPVNLPVNSVQPAPSSTNVQLCSELTASSSNRISQEASLPSVRDTENLNCDCNVIDLSQDKSTPEDNDKCQVVKWSDRIPRGTELHRPVMEKPNSISSSKAISEVPQSSDYIQDNIPDNLQVNISATKTALRSESVDEKCKSESLCGTPEKRLCQDPDNKTSALSNMHTHQVTAMDLSPSTTVDCTTKSTPSQSSPRMLGASHPQLCATRRPSLDSIQHAMNGKGASYVNFGQKNQELCTVSCCEQSRCATHTKRLAAAGSACCGATQLPQQSPNDER